MIKYSDSEKRAEADREVDMRRAVYPDRVRRKIMTQQRANQQIAIMQEIADDYRAREK